MTKVVGIGVLAVVSLFVVSGSEAIDDHKALTYARDFFEKSDENRFQLNILPEYKVDRFVFPPTLPTEIDVPIDCDYSDSNGILVYRIPGGPKSPPSSGKRVAFIQHGILCDSQPCTVNKMQIAIVYLLVDQGYDVWLGLSNSTMIESPLSEHAERDRLQIIAQYIMIFTDQVELLVMGYFNGDVQFFAMTPPQIPKEKSTVSKWFGSIPGAKTVSRMYNKGKKYLARAYESVKERIISLGSKSDTSNNSTVRSLNDNVLRSWGVLYNMVSSTFKVKDFSKMINHPDVYLDAMQLITKYGFVAESHTVMTEDRYLLTIHRISGGEKFPPKDGKPVIFLQHGILSSSDTWLVLGSGKSLAYILADKGYDVWIGNSRGNTYSRAHVNYSVSTAEFWDFSFHEMGMYDLPATIDYIVKHTGQEKMDFIGHSQGTTACIAMLSEKPEYNERIKKFIAYAPVVYANNIRSPIIRLFSRLSVPIWNTLSFLKVREFLPTNSLLTKIGRDSCESQTPYQVVCTNALFMVTGYNSAQINASAVPIILSHFPAGSSLKQFFHFGQEFMAKKFQYFDYGTAETNLQKYGQASPPEYNLNNVKIPVEIFYAPNDWLAVPIDVERLAKNLPNARLHKIPMELFNHIDFTFAMDAPVLVYHPTIEYLQDSMNETIF